jgi:glyoxylase-like metal-dependent hydrolase (beta-lactamase superfamily II)
MPGFVMKRFYSPAFVLRELDLCADEITDVVITHAHHDHIGAIKHFKNAVVHINEDALKSRSGYITDDMMVDTFQDEYIITPEIKVVKWGGHAAASSFVEIKADDVTHIIAGDEYYTNDCLVSGLPTGAYYNLDKAKEFVEKFKAKNYRVHTCHDSLLKTERLI